MILPWYAALALIISLIALFVALRNYNRKSGVQVRGTFTMTSSISCEDKYVSSVTLENIKDRSITIFAIYLRLYPNVYVEIEDHKDKPLLLKPFETYQNSFGPPQFYSSNMQRILLNKLFSDKKVKQSLVISTSNGRYDIPDYILRWDPTIDWFRNHYTLVARPAHLFHKGKQIGGSVLYTITIEGEKSEVIAIHQGDHRRQVLKNVSLTEDSLTSATKLKEHIESETKKNGINFPNFTVEDITAWKTKNYDRYDLNGIEIPRAGYLEYKVWGRFLTYMDTWRMNRENRKRIKNTTPRKEENKNGA